MQVASGGATDVGMVRTNNEDSYQIVPTLQLFVLADGMGGEAHGEVASSLAVETVLKHCLEGQENPAAPLVGEAKPGLSEKSRRLASAIHLANQKVYASAAEHAEQRGMGATLTVAWIDDMNLSVGHVGDSRVYLLRTGGLQQLTSDHSLVAEQVRRGILTASEAESSTMGSSLRYGYTALGDSVNLSSRLEGLNKDYGTHILANETTYAAAQDSGFVFRELDLIRVKGKNQPVVIYELICDVASLTPEIEMQLDCFENARELYEKRRWSEAQSAFQSIIDRWPEDGPARAYWKRCQEYLFDEPPANWDGVFTMTHK